MIELEATASFSAAIRGSKGLLRPFRATSKDPFPPQGVALGWSIAPLRGYVRGPSLSPGRCFWLVHCATSGQGVQARFARGLENRVIGAIGRGPHQSER